MPIIIYGTRGITSDLDSGRFFCPVCDGMQPYTLHQVREYFALFWIPVIPLRSGPEFVRCHACGTPFEGRVLELSPPAEGERLTADEAARVDEALGDPETREGELLRLANRELLRGRSVGIVLSHLQDAGIDSGRAEEAVNRMCGGQAKRCEGCGRRYHPSIHQCGDCWSAL